MPASNPTHPLVQNEILAAEASSLTTSLYSRHDELDGAIETALPANDDSYENLYPSIT